MPKNDDILGLILSGGIGYLLGQESSNEWKPFMDQFRDRFQHLTKTQTPLPWAFLKTSQNIQAIYRQSVYCYLFGLPDACLPTLLRVLDLSLLSMYETAERKKPLMEIGPVKLMDWAEVHLKKDVKVAQSFSMLKNFLRTDNLIQEQDCLEAIRHVSLIMETFCISQNIVINVVCHYCRQAGEASVLNGQGYLGNKMALQCSNCNQTYHWMVMP